MKTVIFYLTTIMMLFLLVSTVQSDSHSDLEWNKSDESDNSNVSSVVNLLKDEFKVKN